MTKEGSPEGKPATFHSISQELIENIVAGNDQLWMQNLMQLRAINDERERALSSMSFGARLEIALALEEVNNAKRRLIALPISWLQHSCAESIRESLEMAAMVLRRLSREIGGREKDEKFV